MKPRQIEFLLTVAAVAAATTTITRATPIPLNDPIASRSDSNNSNPGKLLMRGQKAIDTCLRIAPNLPPCNFDSEATWRSRSSEILHSDPAGSGYPSGSLPDFHPDGSGENILTVEATEQKDGSPISTGEKNLEEFKLYENDLAITVVYYLEGCLPVRLPFDLPSCPIDELQTIQMNKLVPFQLPDLQDALIFPEIDVKQIEFSHRQSRVPSASQSHEETRENNIDPSSKRHHQILQDRSSSLELSEVKPSAKGGQDFHKTMLKSSMIPRTGTANAKYASMLTASSSLTTMASGRPWGSGKNTERSASRLMVKNEGIKPRVEGVNGSREVFEAVVGKGGGNRVQQ